MNFDEIKEFLRSKVLGQRGEVRVDCPACEGSQRETLGINADSGFFQCFRCDVKGNLNNSHEKQPIPEFIWNKSRPVFEHPYLEKKQVPSYGLREDQHENLVVPLYQYGQIFTLQFIDPQGKKVLLKKEKGGVKKGSSFIIPGDLDSEKKIYVCEGYATAATIRKATGCETVMAVDAGNIEPVVENIRRKYSDYEWIFCADNDTNNKGLDAALKAAAIVQGKVTMPEKAGHDFNDLYIEQGIDAVVEQLQKFVDPETEPVKKKGFSLVPISELALQPPDYLVDHYFERDCLCVVFGDSSTAKSFLVAVDLAGCVATGKGWHGNKVKQGKVVLIAGEGHNGLARRFAAWEIRHGQNLNNGNMFVSKKAAQFCDPENTLEVIAAIDQVSQDRPPALVIIDTLARNFGPGDESAPRDMNRFVGAIDNIRAKYGCTIIIIHHTGHNFKHRERGASPLRGAIDASYRVEKDDSGTVRFFPIKMKDAELPDPLAFELVSVQLGIEDEQGRQVTSAIMDQVDWTEPDQDKKGQGKWQNKAQEVLDKLYNEHRENLTKGGYDPDKARVSVNTWRKACLEAGIPKNRFYDLKKHFKIEHGYVY